MIYFLNQTKVGDILFRFRDPIHGFIEVTKLERKIIDTTSFQRLRNIRQLGTSYLVYHGAEHTRFGHSLGVMHLVSRVFDIIVEKQPTLFANANDSNKPKVEWYRQILRLIGLTHDLGHAPFSHASETLFEEGFEHEDMTREILLKTEIAAIISEIGQEFVKKYGSQYDITPDLIWLIYEGKDIFNENYIMPDFKFLKSFMDGELDCDKMDYLLRDSYFCGVQYGHYDLDRLISSFNVYQVESENILLLALEHGGIHALEEFVLARYFMFIQVYFHKTRRYLDKKLSDCLERLLPNGKYPANVNDYLKWDDNKVLNLIQSEKDENPYANEFIKREVLSCVYQAPVHTDTAGSRLFKTFCHLIKTKILDSGVSKADLARYYMQEDFYKFAHKIPEGLHAKDEKGTALPILIKHQLEPSTVYNESLLLRSLKDPITIKRIYVHQKFKELAESTINLIEEDT